MSQANRERLEKAAQERKALAEALREDNFDLGIPTHVTDAVFKKAWDDGHASGREEVAIHYAELAVIVSDAFEAGRKDGAA